MQTTILRKEMDLTYDNKQKSITIVPFDYSYMNKLIEKAFKDRKEEIISKFKKGA